jgi:hypothetical protein
MRKNKIIYSINIEDIQNVAGKELGRELTVEEIRIVEDKIGDQIDWYGAISDVLDKYIAIKEQSDSA